MSTLRVLFIYERGETHAAVRAFRTAFAELPDTQLIFGADTLVFAGRNPTEQIREALGTIDGVLVLLGPAGLAPARVPEAIALREAALMDLPLLFVCAEGVRPPGYFARAPISQLPDLDEYSPDAADLPVSIRQSARTVYRYLYLQATSGATGETDPDEHAAMAESETEENLLGDISELLEADSDALPNTAGDFSAAAEPPANPVAFRAYLPKELPLRSVRGTFVYAYIDEAPEVLRAVEQDIERFRPELGDSVPPAEDAVRRAQLRVGTQLTVVPESEELVFEPPALTKRWRGPWSRFAFDCEIAGSQNTDAPRPGTALGVRVSIQVAGIEIAKIHCLTRVVDAANPAQDNPTPEQSPASPLLASSFSPTRSELPRLEPATSRNPLARAKARQNLTPSEIARPYQNIFVSYSRRDYQITRAYETAQRALGNTVFMDTEGLRSGEDWRAGLARSIDRADILQLFWSRNAARSRNVRDEWEYALESREGDSRGAHFIRPVYWQKPIADVPAELAHLHFHFMPPPGDEEPSEIS